MNETLNEIVVNGMKFLGVKRFYGHEDILADGVIGLVSGW
jgi:hypothetical protein